MIETWARSETGDEQTPTPGARRRRCPLDCRECLSRLAEAGLPASATEEVCQRMWCDRMQRRQVLFLEGNRSTCFYAVRSGKIKLFTVDLRGQEHVTAILGAGDLFGFEAIFDDTYATSAEALTEGELCLGTGDDLRPLVDRNPALARGLARYLHRQLCRTRARQSHLCACGAQAKLAGYLLYRLADSEDRGHQDLVVPDDLTLRDLGSVLGLSPETVCRTLSGFKASGAIEALPSAFRIRDLADLRRLAGS